MGIVTKDNATDVQKVEGFEGHYGTTDGYTIGFEHYTADADLAEFFKGLPDDRCQCPHWGVVHKGRVIYRYADGTEDDIRAGQAYYARPGHTPVIFADTELTEFSPSEEMAKTVEVVMRNAQAMA